MALGAQAGDVVRLIGAAGLRMAIGGTVLAPSGVRSHALHEHAVVGGELGGCTDVRGHGRVLIAVTMAACYVPARRRRGWTL